MSKMRNYGGLREGAKNYEIRAPFGGESVAQCRLASLEEGLQVLEELSQAQVRFQKRSAAARSLLCSEIAAGIEVRRQEFVERIIDEAGKPEGLAGVEVSRAVTVFRLAAEEAKRFGGEILRLDGEWSGEPYGSAAVTWVPRGVVLAIGPFNFPLNLLAHKIAPAFAAGCSVLAKPSPQAPGAAFLLEEVVTAARARMQAAHGASLDEPFFRVLQLENEAAGKLAQDVRVKTISFTGSDRVGWALRASAARKPVFLELGGNAAVLIDATADLKRAAQRCAWGAFAYAGQICISVQRILVHEAVADEFEGLLRAETEKLEVGDPRRPGVLVGPMIDPGARARVEEWTEEALRLGARAVLLGRSQGNLLSPTLLADVPETARLWTEEAFGPVAVINRFSGWAEGIAAANRSRYGLQTGVFTADLSHAREASRNLEAGAVWVNEVPTVRVDSMPYGGIKDSGIGREGIRSTMEAFCERRTVIGLLT